MTKYRLITITMWNINLTKADKRYCRELIHIGLERECEKFVKDMQRLANKPIPLAELNEPYREENGWSVEGPWHKRYIALYKIYPARCHPGVLPLVVPPAIERRRLHRPAARWKSRRDIRTQAGVKPLLFCGVGG